MNPLIDFFITFVCAFVFLLLVVGVLGKPMRHREQHEDIDGDPPLNCRSPYADYYEENEPHH